MLFTGQLGDSVEVLVGLLMLLLLAGLVFFDGFEAFLWGFGWDLVVGLLVAFELLVHVMDALVVSQVVGAVCVGELDFGYVLDYRMAEIVSAWVVVFY